MFASALLEAGVLGGTAESLVSAGWARHAVETATGWVGLVVVGVYSFLIAFVLPLPSETVLAAPIDVLPTAGADLALLIVVSGVGKAAGSVVAFRVGNGVATSGPVLRTLERLGFDVGAWTRRRTVELSRQYGYAGLAGALSVPFFPDTLSIYAFSVLEEDTRRFALATFAGSVGRLLVTLLVLRGALLVA
ncbi:MAG: hypothetical protein ABEJ30_06180 [Halorientalis sp.]